MFTMDVFVCHYTKLHDRKKHIEGKLSSFKNISYSYIEDYDKEEITDKVEEKYFIYDSGERIKRSNFYLKNGPVNLVNYSYKQAEKSIAMKHYTACKKVVENELPYALILEDDVFFCENFEDRLKQIVVNLPEGWDAYFLNSTKGMLGNKCEDIENNDYVVKRGHPSTACLNSYLIHNKACKKIVEEIENNKISLHIDHEFNCIFYKNDFNVYFNKHKPLTVTGYMKSSIQV